MVILHCDRLAATLLHTAFPVSLITMRWQISHTSTRRLLPTLGKQETTDVVAAVSNQLPLPLARAKKKQRHLLHFGHESLCQGVAVPGGTLRCRSQAGANFSFVSFAPPHWLQIRKETGGISVLNPQPVNVHSSSPFTACLHSSIIAARLPETRCKHAARVVPLAVESNLRLAPRCPSPRLARLSFLAPPSTPCFAVWREESWNSAKSCWLASQYQVQGDVK